MGIIYLIRIGNTRTLIQRLPREIYNTLREVNYDYEILSRRHVTAGVTIRSYELLNMHATDADPLLDRLLKDVKTDEVLYDIGANIGTYSLVLATAHPSVTIHCFEPDPTTATWLRANIEANDLGNRITPHQRGISDTKGSLTFHSIGAHRKSSFERTQDVETTTTVDEVTVPVTTLDSLATEFPPPDRLKIDVEGHGEAVLTGGRELLQMHGPVVYFEPHGNEDSIVTLFEAVGYQIERRSGYWVAFQE